MKEPCVAAKTRRKRIKKKKKKFRVISQPSLATVVHIQLIITVTGEGNGNPLQCSCLGNPMDRGAWRATVHMSQRVGQDLATKQ